jgi:hypothetical protein
MEVNATTMVIPPRAMRTHPRMINPGPGAISSGEGSNMASPKPTTHIGMPNRFWRRAVMREPPR